MSWLQEEARLSGLVFLNDNDNDIGLRRPSSPLEHKRTGCSLVTVRHPDKTQEPTIVVLGGREGRSAVTCVDVWHVETKRWSKGPSMPEARTYLTSVVAGDHIYVIGGINSDGKPLKTIKRVSIQDLLEPRTSTDNEDDKTWKPFPCCLGIPRVLAKAVSVQDWFIVVAGGITHQQDPIASVEIIDTHSPHSSVSFPGPDLNYARHSFGMEVVQNRVYVVGGECKGSTVLGHSVEYLDFDPPGLNTTYVQSKETLSTSTMTWIVHGDRNLGNITSSDVVRVGHCLLFADRFVEVLDTKRNISWKFEYQSDSWDPFSPCAMTRVFTNSKGKIILDDSDDTDLHRHGCLWYKRLAFVDKESFLFQRLLDCSVPQIQSLQRQSISYMDTID